MKSIKFIELHNLINVSQNIKINSEKIKEKDYDKLDEYINNNLDSSINT